MGNIRGWGGPLSPAWHQRSLTLQKQILQRLRDFGVIPVLPAFAGHLPRAFKRYNLTYYSFYSNLQFLDSILTPTWWKSVLGTTSTLLIVALTF